MILLAALLLATGDAPAQPEPKPEIPAAASIHARKVTTPDHRAVEGRINGSVELVSADDVMDEMLDEFGADVARLGGSQIGPMLLDRIHVSENMNPAYTRILEARLVAAVFRAANIAIVRCLECFITRSRVEQDAWVVSRGITRREDAQAVAKKYGARTFLDVSLTLNDKAPQSLGMDVELVRAEDASIAFAESYRLDPRTALLYRGADKAQAREEHLRELEDRLNQRPHLSQEVQVGAMMIPSDLGALWAGAARFVLSEQFGEDRGHEAGVVGGGFLSGQTFNGGLVGAQYSARLGAPNSFGPETWMYAQGDLVVTAAGNTFMATGGLRFITGARITLRGGIGYMAPVTYKAKQFGGVVPEIGVAFLWR